MHAIMHAHMQLKTIPTYVAIQEGRFMCVKVVHGTVYVQVHNINRLLIVHTSCSLLYTCIHLHIAI